MYHFRCDSCGTVLMVPDHALGRLVPCPDAKCGGKTRLPEAAAVNVLPWAEVAADGAPTTSGASLTGFLEGEKLRRRIAELERALEVKFREIGAGAYDPMAGGESLGEARAAVVEAERRLAGARADLNALGGSPPPSLANDLRREVDRLARERDEAVGRLGRRAFQTRERVDPAALGDVQRLEAMLAEHRSRLDALGGGIAEAAGRVKASVGRLVKAAAVLLSLFGLGWTGFMVCEHAATGGPPAGRGDPSRPGTAAADAAVCLIVQGWRVEQSNGDVTEARALPPPSEGAPRDYFDGGTGTGFAITPDGWILTNGHVVSRAWSHWNAGEGKFDETLLNLASGGRLKIRPVVWVFFGKDRKYEARLVDYRMDETTGVDVCLMKIDRPDGEFLPLSTDPRPSRGARVRSLGFPDYAAKTLTGEDERRMLIKSMQALSLQPSTIEDAFKDDDFEFSQTSGEVSKVAIPGGAGDRPWIFHTAALSHGNSGGPLLSEGGVVVGINTKYEKGGGVGEIGVASGFLAQTVAQFRAMIEARTTAARWAP